jgi:hypothetical protein
VAAAVGGFCALIAVTIGLSRFAGALANALNQDGEQHTWPFVAGLTITEFLFAVIALGCGIGAVLPKAGRRPGFVVVLVVTAVAFGWAFSDAIYQFVTAAYDRS